jgi:hypothetical protein
MSWNLWNQEGFKNMYIFKVTEMSGFVDQGKMIMIILSKATNFLSS